MASHARASNALDRRSADATGQAVPASTCHNDRAKAGDLTLAAFDAANVADHADTRREDDSQAARRHDAARRREASGRSDARCSWRPSLETRIDRAAALAPNPGHRPFQRLNRAEYDRAIHDLLSIDVDVDALLPPDTISHGFDNIADVQAFSPTVLEGYLRAAAKISRDALGDPTVDADVA